MGNKKSFVIYDNWSTLLCGLPNEEAGKLIKAICAYKLGELKEIDDPVIAAMFNMIKEKLDEDADSYEETCKARSESGKKGAEKRWNNKQKQNIANAITAMTNDSKAKQNIADNDTDTDNDTVTDTDTKSPTETKERVKREKTSLTQDQMHSMLLESALSCQTQDKVREWIQYKQARREPYKEMGFKSLISQIHKHEREAGYEAVCDLIDLCMSNEWKGIIWDKLPREIPQRAAPGGKIDWANI